MAVAVDNKSDSNKSKAYHEGLKYKKSGLEEEVIYAKLEKQGIPIDLAKEVAMNVIIERDKDNKEDLSDYKKIGIVMIVIWILASLIAYYFTESIFAAVGLLVVGIPTTILAHLMSTNK
ncbi:MAG: hypothetical protein WBM92_01780 [Aureibaculum sp.]